MKNDIWPPQADDASMSFYWANKCFSAKEQGGKGPCTTLQQVNLEGVHRKFRPVGGNVPHLKWPNSRVRGQMSREIILARESLIATVAAEGQRGGVGVGR